MSLEDTLAPATPAESTPAAPSTEAPAEAPVAEVVDDGADLSAELAKVWEKSNPTRDEQGRFVARETKAEEAPADEAAPAEEVQAEAQELEAPKSTVEAPRAWTADAKAKWATLPPDLQTYVASREQELQEVRTATGRLEAEYRPLREALKQYEPYLNQVAHGDVAGYVNRMLAASYAMDTDPAGTIKALADAYGVDLGQIYDPLAEPPNPEVVRLRQENDRLKAAQQAAERQRATSTEVAQQQAVGKLVDEFYSKHPDAREIEDDFAAEIAAIRHKEPNLDLAAVLEKAYERAAWANPDMRQKRIEAAQKEAEAKRIAAAKEAAAKAKSAASVNVQGSPNPNAEPDDPNEALRAIWRKRHAA